MAGSLFDMYSVIIRIANLLAVRKVGSLQEQTDARNVCRRNHNLQFSARTGLVHCTEGGCDPSLDVSGLEQRSVEPLRTALPLLGLSTGRPSLQVSDAVASELALLDVQGTLILEGSACCKIGMGQPRFHNSFHAAPADVQLAARCPVDEGNLLAALQQRSPRRPEGSPLGRLALCRPCTVIGVAKPAVTLEAVRLFVH